MITLHMCIKNKYKFLLTAIAIVSVCLVIINSIAWAHAPSSYPTSKISYLAAQSALSNPEFREKVRAMELLLAHDAVNNYIRSQIEKEKWILGKDWEKRKIRQVNINDPSIRGNIKYIVKGLDSVMLVSITGLLSHAGQHAHVGLRGKDYGDITVIYIDSQLFNERANIVQKHEIDEVLQWEHLRANVLRIEDKAGMRKWIKEHINSIDDRLVKTEFKGKNTRQIAKIFHDRSYRLGGLKKQYAGRIDFDYAYIDSMISLYGLDEENGDLNIAARREQQPEATDRKSDSDEVVVSRHGHIIHAQVTGRDALGYKPFGLALSRMQSLSIKARALLNRLFARSVTYADVFKELKQYPAKNILLITDFKTEKRRLGDTLVYYRPAIQSLLRLFPESGVTIVSDEPELWNGECVRLKVLPKNEFIKLLCDDTAVLGKRLRSLRENTGLDMVVCLDKFRYPHFQEAATSVFQACLFANSGEGVAVKLGDERNVYPLLPWIPHFNHQKNIPSQVTAFLLNAAGPVLANEDSLILKISKEDEEWLNATIATENKEILLLNLFSMRLWKDWRHTENIAKFIEEAVMVDGMRVVFPAPIDMEQRNVLDDILHHLPAMVRENVVIPTDGGLHKLKLLIHRADYVVTVDTGVSHLAVALGKEPIVLYYKSFRNQAYYVFLSWLPSLTTRHNKDYIATGKSSSYSPKELLAKVRAQKKRRVAAPEKVSKDRYAPKITIKGADDIVVSYDRTKDILVVFAKSALDNASGLDGVSARYGIAKLYEEYKTACSRKGRGPSWAYYRAGINNMTYFDESNATITPLGGSNTTITYADSGLVAIIGLNNLCVIKQGGDITIYGPDNMDEAESIIIDILKKQKIKYKKPKVLLERITMPVLNETRIKRLLFLHYGFTVKKTTPFKSGKVKNSAFLVELDDGRKLVFKYVGRNSAEASTLLAIAEHKNNVFPMPFRVKDGFQKSPGCYIVDVDGAYFALEEFIEERKDKIIDQEYFYKLGRALGVFHKEMKDAEAGLSDLGLKLPHYLLNRDSSLLFRIDFALAACQLEHTVKDLSPAEQALRDNVDFILEQINILRKSDYVSVFEGLPSQIVHRDPSVSNTFLNGNDHMRLIDMEGMCAAPRVLEFTHALIGIKAGAPLMYMTGAFKSLTKGYNETSATPLSGVEEEMIKLLVRSRFLRQLVVDLIKNPVNNKEHLENMLSSFRRFCEECPIDTEKFIAMSGKTTHEKPRHPPQRIGFSIPFPVDLFDGRSFARMAHAADATTIRERLNRNMYYANAPPARKEKMIQTISELTHVVPFVMKYFKEKHPELGIINISLFGSYLYGDERSNPADVDFLVLVRGNHFLLEEIPIDLKEYEAGKYLKPSVKALSFSIKGEDNFGSGSINETTKEFPTMQRIIVGRTVAALYNRHVVLFGPDFRNNSYLLRNNALAEAADLLINSYLRLYEPNPIKGESEYVRIRKVFARLHEASVYLASFYPQLNINSEEFYNLRIRLERGDAGFKEADEAWRRLHEMVEGLYSQRILYAFDYDKTLTGTDGKISMQAADALANILLSGQSAAIVTSRSIERLTGIDSDLLNCLKEALRRNRSTLTQEQAKECFGKFFVFASKGSEKYLFDYAMGRVEQRADASYTRVFSEEEKDSIVAIIRDVLKEYNCDRDLDEENGIGFEKRSQPDGYINIRIRFKDGSAGNRIKEKIARAIRERVGNLSTLFREMAVIPSGKSIGMNPKHKGIAIKHIFEEMGFGKIYYYGDEPERGDKGVFDLADLYGPEKLLCIKVAEPGVIQGDIPIADKSLGREVINESSIPKLDSDQKYVRPSPQPPVSVPDAADQYATQNAIDIESAINLMNSLITAELEKGRAYEIRYDSARLQEYQRKAKISEEFSPEALLIKYVQCLQARVPCKDPKKAKEIIKLIKCPSEYNKERPSISVTCYDDISKTHIIGEGWVNIKGDLQGQALRIISMLNMALAASNIPNLPDKLSEYSHFVAIIEAQYKKIAGKELSKDESGNPLSPGELLKAIKFIELPSSEQIPLANIEGYYRLTITQLEQAA